jgi:hypothetical protein
VASLVEFDVKTPLDKATIARHAAHAHGLGLPRAIEAKPLLTVVTGGPSALEAPLREGPILALNGALRLFVREGVAPTYWACCDPQALVADFLADAPEETIYYVASSCHPDVFRVLKTRDVRIFDTDDHVPGGIACAPSITLTALNLFVAMGHRAFDVWGWDCAYRGELDHAIAQNHQAERLSAEVGGRRFDTTMTWIHEAQSAAQILPILEYVGAQVNIRGDSLVTAARLALRPAA